MFAAYRILMALTIWNWAFLQKKKKKDMKGKLILSWSLKIISWVGENSMCHQYMDTDRSANIKIYRHNFSEMLLCSDQVGSIVTFQLFKFRVLTLSQRSVNSTDLCMCTQDSQRLLLFVWLNLDRTNWLKSPFTRESPLIMYASIHYPSLYCSHGC